MLFFPRYLKFNIKKYKFVKLLFEVINIINKVGTFLKNFATSKGSKREFEYEAIKKGIFILCFLLSLFLIYYSVFSYTPTIRYRGVFIGVLVAVALIYYKPPEIKIDKVRIIDYIMAALSLICGGYLALNVGHIIHRIPQFHDLATHEIVLGLIMLLLVMEATRRVAGWPLFVITILFATYPFFGVYVPGLFGHRGFEFVNVIDTLYMTTNGIIGIPIGIASTYVFMFVVFGKFLNLTGGGEYFFDLARSISGGARGGLAKTAVIASAFFGSITGSPISNVATTGVLTIPIMQKSGYPGYFASAVETAASCGGTLLPPVMGAVAFVMADFLGIPYTDVLLAAIVPALLFYGAVFYSVDTQAKIMNLKGEDKASLPPLFKTFVSGLQYILPFVWLIYRLFQGITVTRCAFESVVVMVVVTAVVSILNKDIRKKLKIKNFVDGLGNSILALLPIAIACAAAGIIIGMVSMTGLGAKFSSLVLSLAGDALFLILILTALLVIILGMGMSITPTYVLGAALAAPAMIDIGVNPIAAHLFIVYYAGMATMTPPICLAAYTAAGISNDDALKVGFTAVKIGIVAYIIPIVFVYSPALILQEPFSLATVILIFTTVLGVAALTIGINKFLFVSLNFYETILFFISCIILLYPVNYISIFGIAVFAALVGYNFIKMKKKEKQLDQSAV